MNDSELLDAVEDSMVAPKTVQQLRGMILRLAVQGRLAAQDPTESDAMQLVAAARTERRRLAARKVVRDEDWDQALIMSDCTDLPAGWIRAPLAMYVAVIMGQSPPSTAYNKTGVGIPFYQGKAQFGRLHPTPTDWCTEPTKLGEAGDVLISVRAPVGPTNLLTETACVGRGLAALRSLGGDQRYLLYALRAAEARIAAMGVGSTFTAISKHDLDTFMISIPPLAEQKRIVAKVDELMALCDRLQAQLKQRDEQAGVLAKAAVARFQADPTVENLEYLFHETYEIDADLIRQAILRLAVRGRFETQHASDKPAADAIEEAGALPTPARYEGRSRATIQGLGGLSVGPSMLAIPPGWECVPLIKIARIESGHTPSRSRPEWWGGDVPWIGVSDARKHNGGTIHQTHQSTNSLGLANSAARLLPTGTVCVSRTASVGYVVVLGRPMATSQDFVSWVPGQAVSSEWLRLVFMAERDGFQLFSKGAVHQTIYYPEWLSMHILLPPIAEQRRIVAKVNELMALVDQLESQITASEDLGTELLDALVAELAPSN